MAYLNISGNQIFAFDLEQLTAGIQGLKQLSELDISCNALTKGKVGTDFSGVIAFAEALALEVQCTVHDASQPNNFVLISDSATDH